jgi:hypothetical protein
LGKENIFYELEIISEISGGIRESKIVIKVILDKEKNTYTRISS